MVYVLSTAHKQSVFSIIEFLHALDRAGAVKVWETAYVATLSLFDCHSLCLHILFFEFLFFPSRLLLLSEPSARGLSAHCRGICQGSQRQGFQDDFPGKRQNLAETPARPWLCSPMPNFAPINPIGQVQRSRNYYKRIPKLCPTPTFQPNYCYFWLKCWGWMNK